MLVLTLQYMTSDLLFLVTLELLIVTVSLKVK